MATRRYFRSPEAWTSDRDDAFDFGFVSRAVKIAHKLRIPDLELVLSFDDPEEAPATPFGKLLRGLAPSKARHRERRKCRYA